MSSAACYTNRRRVIAESSLTKVQYPGRIENQNPLLPVQNCSPNFSTLNYLHKIVCGKPCPTSQLGEILDGGNALTDAPTILDGGNYATESPTILDGNS